MRPEVFAATLRDIDRNTEGGAVRLNIRTRGGCRLYNSRISNPSRAVSIVRCDADGYPPIYLDVADIELVEVSTGEVRYASPFGTRRAG